ncbi:TonB-dependent receptor domain-containing protein [Flavobacterium sp.]|uniref:TonB-dependent receptor n=1 Tax=Flavobacterium sp. TaxID=239 RepID=UPI00286DEDE6|nr:TonB-dependent receptor [Flavobacterium sp.]
MGLNRYNKLRSNFLFILFTILTSQFITANTVKLQNINNEFSAELLESRLFKIEKIGKINIAFDVNMVKKTEVPALSAKNKSVENVLKSTLSTTSFMYKKLSNDDYIIVEDKTPVQNQQKGTIKGTVLDQQGLPVPGVNITVVETGAGTQSGYAGEYSLSLPQGTYTLDLSMLSYKKKRITAVVVTSGKTTSLNIVMDESTNVLNEVVVTTSYRKASTASLFALQKKTVSFTDGISAEQIKLTPDNNVADVLKRVSGVTMQDNKFIVVRGMSERYNSVQLNGASLPSTEPNRRNFSFDIIPSNLIDNVIIAKTFTPDMSGEFAGGAVQVNTLSVPQEKFLTLSIGNGFNSQSFGKDFFSNTRYKEDYFLGTDKRDWFKNGWSDEYKKVYLRQDLGINPNAQAQYNLAGELPNHWGLQKFNANPSQSYAITGGMPFTFQDGSTIGFTSAFTYRNEESREDYEWNDRFFPEEISKDGIKSSFVTVVAGLFNTGWKNTNHRVDFRNIYNRRFTHDNSSQTDSSPAFVPIGFQFRTISSVRENTLWQTRLDGEHKLFNKKVIFNWFGDFNEVVRDQPDDRFNTADVFALATPTTPPVYNWFEANTGNNNVFKGAGLFASILKEKKWNAGTNIEFNFKVAGNNQKLKTGYWGTFRSADYRQDLQSITVNRNIILTSELYATIKPIQELFAPENFTSGAYLLEPYNVGLAGTSNNANKYDGTQNINAGYIMGDFTLFKKLHFIGGFRLELTDIKLNTVGRKVGPTGGRIFVDSLLTFKERDVLPSITATYDLLFSLKFRAAYSRTLARPDFRERAPFIYFDLNERLSVNGNGSLLNPSATNYDLRLEWYPSPREIVSISAFRKYFTNAIETVVTAFSGGETSLYINLNEAKVKGIEFNARKHFGFITKDLENLYVSGNLSLLKGSVSLDPVDVGGNLVRGSTRDRNPNGLSPLNWNAGLSYNLDKIGATVNYNYLGEKIRFAGADEETDIYDADRGTLDAQLRFKLMKNKVELKLNASDITAQPFIVYVNAFDFKDTNDQTLGRIATNGKGYDEGEDRVLRKSLAGTTYSFSITYSF